MRRYTTPWPTLVFMALSLLFTWRLISAAYRLVSGSGEDQPSSQKLRLPLKCLLVTGAGITVSQPGSFLLPTAQQRSCSDMHRSVFVYVRTGGPTTGPTSTENSFDVYMFYLRIDSVPHRLLNHTSVSFIIKKESPPPPFVLTCAWRKSHQNIIR